MQSPDDLPEPAGLLAHEDGSGFVDCYTAEQMRAYRAECVAQERERCAKVCEEVEKDFCPEPEDLASDVYYRGISQGAKICAKAIRAGHTTS